MLLVASYDPAERDRSKKLLDILLFDAITPSTKDANASYEIAVCRRAFLLIAIKENVAEILSYNIHPSLFDNICNLISCAVQWNTYKSSFLTSVAFAKMGLFIPIPSTTTTLDSSFPQRCQTLSDLKVLLDIPQFQIPPATLLNPGKAVVVVLRTNTHIAENMKGHRPQNIITSPVSTPDPVRVI